jgi:hypothetical protein
MSPLKTNPFLPNQPKFVTQSCAKLREVAFNQTQMNPTQTNQIQKQTQTFGRKLTFMLSTELKSTQIKANQA